MHQCNFVNSEMNVSLRKIACLLPLPSLIFFLSCNLTAQSLSTDSTDPVKRNAVRIFTSALGDQAAVYNGVQYRRYPHVIHAGHPFFIADKLEKGTVTYDGHLYEDLNLMYDVVNDELITTDVPGDNLVKLYKRKVQAFTIGPHKFIHIASAQASPRPGYYRLLYNGKSQIIVRETKSIQVKTGRTKEETERTVYASTDYYLLTPTGYKKFNRLNSFLSLLGKNRKAVENFIRQKKMRSQADREEVFYRAAAYVDQLTD